MDELGLQLDDVVVFELPTLADSEAFSARLRSRWPGWSDADEGVWLFTAELQGGRGELAKLLHAAEELLVELGLAAIRFYVDGRVYVLEPTRPLRDSAPGGGRLKTGLGRP
jgi:hypothetical protein